MYRADKACRAGKAGQGRAGKDYITKNNLLVIWFNSGAARRQIGKSGETN